MQNQTFFISTTVSKSLRSFSIDADHTSAEADNRPILGPASDTERREHTALAILHPTLGEGFVCARVCVVHADS